MFVAPKSDKDSRFGKLPFPTADEEESAPEKKRAYMGRIMVEETNATASEDAGQTCWRQGDELSSVKEGVPGSEPHGCRAGPGTPEVEDTGGDQGRDGKGRPWCVRASAHALAIVNPIRSIMDAIKVEPKPGKELISLGQGDPSIFRNLPPPQEAVRALVQSAESGNFNGYPHSAGLPECRTAIARHVDADMAKHGPLLKAMRAEDVFVTVGASQALHLCIAALANPLANILLPRPGFPLYQMLCQYERVEPRFYDLHPEHGWEADIAQVEALCDSNTVALLICNPSNPCGAVFSRQHLAELALLAERRRLVIISDEIYSDMVFDNCGEFFSMGEIAMGRAPVLLTGGISKRWMVPGWRLGWAAIVDPENLLGSSGVHEAITRLVQMINGTSSIVQAAVPSILADTPPLFFLGSRKSLEASARVCVQHVAGIPGLSCPVPPQGTMYMMVKIDMASFPSITDDVDFARLLLQEEALVLLPGAAFGLPFWLRVVFAAPEDVLQRAWVRIRDFCTRRHC